MAGSLSWQGFLQFKKIAEFHAFFIPPSTNLLNRSSLRKTHYTPDDALQALIQGREEGLGFFFQQYYTRLCYFATTLLYDDCLAQEITSDAFTKLWQSRQSLATEGSIKAWLYSTVRNAAIDHLRKVKRLRVSESGLQSATTIEQSVLHTIIQTETIDHIVQTIGKLPPQCRRIFRLFYLHGKSYNEIAQELNLSPQTVRNQKLRATKLLRKMILPLFFLLSLYSFL
jgi:RNA polymerase sigma-70 factor (family 1)